MFPEIEDDKVPTEQFLRACQGIANFVGLLGIAFIPIKNDISGNITKIRTKYESGKDKYKYIEDLIEDDLVKNNGKMGTATEGLLWLKRGLEFMFEFLSEMVRVYQSTDKRKTDSLTDSINNAYNNTLKRHHGFISKQLFKVVLLAAPTRSSILKALAEGREGVDDICIGHIATHLDNFRTNVAHIVNYYIIKKLDTPNPVLS
ncbi:Glycolipid transfer protein (GLTP) family protein [Acanthocheilonema viteae]